MKIYLNKKQLQRAIELAIERHEAKDQSFRNASIYFPQKRNEFGISNEYIPHLIGVLGEMAWAAANGLQIDQNIYKVRDMGEDFDGVEIKTTTYFGAGEPELKIKKKEFESKRPKLYVLMRVNPNTLDIEVLGKITREKFNQNKVVKKYGPNLPENFIVPLSKMEKVN